MLPKHLPHSISTSTRIIVNRYQVTKKIGNGTFGTVFLVEDNFKNKEKKVLKEICIGEMNEHETQSVDREANLLSKLNHHNIVRMFESFVHEESFYIVMEFCEMGDLDKELKEWKNKRKAVPQEQTLDWFVELLMAVQYIHSQKMLHRDLKCKNVFLTGNKTVKVGDFGISRILTSTEYASTFTGTPYYMSPEVIQHEGYGSKSDIWSLGVILYEICELKRAFDGKNLMSVMMKIIQGNFPKMSDKREGLDQIFQKMLRSDPHVRPSSSELLTEPLIARHVTSLRKRLHNKKRDRNVSSASSQHSGDSQNSGYNSHRKMTARERMRVEKQRKADEAAEQLRHAASENFAANRARTAARREREHNRPNFIQQTSPALEIKAINPNVIRHDKDFCYSPKGTTPPSPSITAIHPEPRPRIITTRRDQVDRQLDALEKSMEYAKAEELSNAIRRSQSPGAHDRVEVDGVEPVLQDRSPSPGINSDEEELIESGSTGSTIDDFEERVAQLPETLKGSDIEDILPDPKSFSDNDTDSIEEDLLFETADEVCLLDMSNLELTAVSAVSDHDVPENEEDANTFYSFEDFEEAAPPTPRTKPPAPLFKRSSSLELRRVRDTERLESLNRSLPVSSTTTSQFCETDISHVSDLERLNNSNILDNSDSYNNRLQVDLNTSNTSNASNKSDYTKASSTIILRSDRIKTLRTKCEQRLGPNLFPKVYDYLESARFGRDSISEEVIVSTLKDWVPELTSDCFLVDQLIYLEKQELLAKGQVETSFT